MKRINTQSTFTINPSVEALERAKQYDPDHRHNVQSILFSVLEIERQLAGGIETYFFGSDLSMKQVLSDLVISTSSFSFSDKRRAFLHILREQNLLSGKLFSEFEKLLSHVMRYRNMFAHGMVVYEADKTLLVYFNGKQKEDEISDEYLEKIESQINQCYEQTQQLAHKIKKCPTIKRVGPRI